MKRTKMALLLFAVGLLSIIVGLAGSEPVYAASQVLYEIQQVRVADSQIGIIGWAIIYEGPHHGEDPTKIGPQYTLILRNKNNPSVKYEFPAINNNIPYNKLRDSLPYKIDHTCVHFTNFSKETRKKMGLRGKCMQYLAEDKVDEMMAIVKKNGRDDKSRRWYRDIGFKFVIKFGEGEGMLPQPLCSSEKIKEEYTMDIRIEVGGVTATVYNINIFEDRIFGAAAKQIVGSPAPTEFIMVSDAGWAQVNYNRSKTKISYNFPYWIWEPYYPEEVGKTSTFVAGQVYSYVDDMDFSERAGADEKQYKPYRLKLYYTPVKTIAGGGAKAYPIDYNKPAIKEEFVWFHSPWAYPYQTGGEVTTIVPPCKCDSKVETCEGEIELSCHDTDLKNPYEFYSEVGTEWVNNKHCIIGCDERAYVTLPSRPLPSLKARTGFFYDFDILNDIKCNKTIVKYDGYNTGYDYFYSLFDRAKREWERTPKPTDADYEYVESLYDDYEQKKVAYETCVNEARLCVKTNESPPKGYVTDNEVCARGGESSNTCKSSGTGAECAWRWERKYYRGGVSPMSNNLSWNNMNKGETLMLKPLNSLYANLNCLPGDVLDNNGFCIGRVECAEEEPPLGDIYIPWEKVAACKRYQKTQCKEGAGTGTPCGYYYYNACNDEKVAKDRALEKWEEEYEKYQDKWDKYNRVFSAYKTAEKNLEEYEADRTFCNEWTAEGYYESVSNGHAFEVEGNDFPYLALDPQFELAKFLEYNVNPVDPLNIQINTKFRIPAVYIEDYTGRLSITPKSYLYRFGDYKFYTDKTVETGKKYKFDFKVNNINSYPYAWGTWSIKYTCDYQAVNEFPTKEQGGEQTYMFRPISLINPFPGNRDTGYNWQGKEHLLTPYINHKPVYSEDNVIYTVNLTPMDMKRIRQYNSSRLYVDVPYTSEGKNNFIRHEFSNLFKKGNGFIR